MLRGCMLLCLLGAVLLAAAAAPYADDEFVGPFPSWKNVKTDFGAVGDGKADDTDALQKALDSLATSYKQGESHLWFPVGTYRITRTLVCTGRAGIGILGEHPDTTIIRWDGPAYDGAETVPPFNSDAWKAWNGRHPSEMLWLNARNSRVGRLTFDGAGTAFAGIAYKWHDSKAPEQVHSTRLNVHDMVFRDMAIGFDGGGKQLWLDSEVTMARCRFLRCTRFGVGLRHFNSVDYWLWHCLFEECGVAVSNEPLPHGGSFHVYNSIFLRSKIADASIYHTQYDAMRDNVSIGSRRFFLAKMNSDNGAMLTLTGNRIIDPGETDTIRLEQAGSAIIGHNTISYRQPAAAGDGPTIRVGLEENTLASALVVNNLFENVPAAQPVAVSGQGVLYNNRVRRGKVTEPDTAFVGVLPNRRQQIFEVAPGADAVAVQQAIDAAVAYAAAHPGARPVVHLPWGQYKIDRTLVVPAKAPIQLVGDNYYPDWQGTMLQWTGKADPDAGVILLLQGPSKATLRNLAVLGPKATRSNPDGPLRPDVVAACIRVEGAEGRGARVFFDECDTNGNGIGLLVDGLDQTVIECRSHQGAGFGYSWRRDWDAKVIGTDPYWPYPAIRAIGGPKSRKGETPGGVWVYGTDTARFQVQDGARMLVRDTWYENNALPFYTGLSGKGLLTIDTMFNANYDHPTLKGCSPTYDLKDFTGTLVLLNNMFARPFPKPAEEKMLGFRGDCAGATVLSVNVRDARSFLPETPANVTAGHVNYHTGVKPDDMLGTVGKGDPAWVTALLAHTLDAQPIELITLPAGVTDARFYRVYTGDGRVGVHLRP